MNNQMSLVAKAADWAEKELSSHTRADGSSAFDHSIKVMEYLAHDLNIYNPKLLSGAILHDIKETNPNISHKVPMKFGKDVDRYVTDLTRQFDSTDLHDDVEKMSTKLRQDYDLYKKGSEQSLLIRLADRIDNLQHIKGIKRSSNAAQKIPRWLLETKLGILPLAHSVNPKAFRDLKDIVLELEHEFEDEINTLFSNYSMKYMVAG